MKKIFRYGIITLAFLYAMVSIGTAATVTKDITYQGILTDTSGNPLTGTYSITFKLYEVASGGTALATSTQSVSCTNGQFTTPVTFDATFFDGRALWIGVSVAPNPEMSPRQELRAVPYALSLRPGAIIKGSGVDYGLKVVNDYSGIGVYANVSSGGALVGDSGSGTGVYGRGKTGGMFTTTQGGTSTSWSGLISGVEAQTTFNYNPALRFRTFGNDSPGVYGRASGVRSPGIYSSSDQDTGVMGIGKTGGYFSTNGAGTGWNDLRSALSVETIYDYNTGISVNTSRVASQGIRSTTSGYDSAAVRAETLGDNSWGVYVRAFGANSGGISAWSKNENGVYGEYGGSTNKKAGIYGYSQLGIGVNGTSYMSSGVQGQSTMWIGVNGSSVNNAGVKGYSESGNGVIGASYYNAGVQGTSERGYAVVGNALTSAAKGVYASSKGNTALEAVVSEGTGNAIYAAAGPGGGYAAVFKGNVEIQSRTTGTPVMRLGEGLDYAEGFNVTVKESIEPGTVLVINPDDPGNLTISTESYDRKVAGIVSGAGGLDSAVKVGIDRYDHYVALAGRVYCYVDTSYGAIEPGDLLTTSPTPGYAMVVKDYQRAQGAILGKAMESLPAGEIGQILVLLTLQ